MLKCLQQKAFSFTGISKYTTLFWAGDQNVDYTKSDGLASTIPAALSVGLQVCMHLCTYNINKI